MNEQLRNAASLVLDAHDKTAKLNTADDLLDTINLRGINEPRVENNALQSEESTSSMTNRNDPQNLLSSRGGPKDYTKSVPLPDDDDLDLWWLWLPLVLMKQGVDR